MVLRLQEDAEVEQEAPPEKPSDEREADEIVEEEMDSKIYRDLAKWGVHPNGYLAPARWNDATGSPIIMATAWAARAGAEKAIQRRASAECACSGRKELR